MSNYFGYACLTCGTNSPHHFNHGEQLLSDLYWSWPRWLALEDSPIGMSGWLTLGIMYQVPWGEVVEFLRAHYPHAMQLQDEGLRVYAFVPPTTPKEARALADAERAARITAEAATQSAHLARLLSEQAQRAADAVEGVRRVRRATHNQP